MKTVEYARMVDKLLNQILPQAGKLVLDIGLVNELAIETRKLITPPSEALLKFENECLDEMYEQLKGCDDIQMDPDSAVSIGETGVWVQCWMYLDKETPQELLKEAGLSD